MKALTFAGVIGKLIALINQILPVLGTLALVLFLWGCVRYIMNSEEAAHGGADRTAILWGLISLFVIFSVWGLLRIMCGTFLAGGSC